MNKLEAREILRKQIAAYAVKYPLLIGKCGKYIGSHPDTDEAIANVVFKLIELDMYVEWEFRQQLNTEENI